MYLYKGYPFKFDPRRDETLKELVDSGIKILDILNENFNPNPSNILIKQPITYLEALSLGNVSRKKKTSSGGTYTTKSKYKDVILSQVEFQRMSNIEDVKYEIRIYEHITEVLSKGSLPKIISYFEKFQEYLTHYYSMSYYWVWYDQVHLGGNFKEPSALGNRGGFEPRG